MVVEKNSRFHYTKYIAIVRKEYLVVRMFENENDFVIKYVIILFTVFNDESL